MDRNLTDRKTFTRRKTTRNRGVSVNSGARYASSGRCKGRHRFLLPSAGTWQQHGWQHRSSVLYFCLFQHSSPLPQLSPTSKNELCGVVALKRKALKLRLLDYILLYIRIRFFRDLYKKYKNKCASVLSENYVLRSQFRWRVLSHWLTNAQLSQNHFK